MVYAKMTRHRRRMQISQCWTSSEDGGETNTILSWHLETSKELQPPSIMATILLMVLITFNETFSTRFGAHNFNLYQVCIPMVQSIMEVFMLFKLVLPSFNPLWKNYVV